MQEQYCILKYCRKNGICPFDNWLSGFENTIKQIVDQRLTRMRVGLFGDNKYLGHKLYEIKINYGPGYRIYYYITNNKILILNAGEKKTQIKDIKEAKKYLVSFLSEGNYAS